MCCTVSVSFMQNLQVGAPSDRPKVYRCPLTGACPVKMANVSLKRYLLNLSRSSALMGMRFIIIIITTIIIIIIIIIRKVLT
jgi:hypothetical protein